jgi:hypothetical protein
MNRQQKDEHIEAANVLFKECSIYISLARDSELQKEVIQKIEAFSLYNATMKAAAVEAGNEDFANVCLGIESVSTALRSEILMWVLLKQDKPDAAWDELVTAQIATADAIRAHGGFHQLEDAVERLDTLEEVVFPPQVYLSMGTTVGRKICSICGDDYFKCEHISGRPYWGEFCRTVLRNVVPDHVAIVKEPANKRCRVLYFDDEGGQRNRMTWKVEPKTDPAENAPEEGLRTTGILATALPGRDW